MLALLTLLLNLVMTTLQRQEKALYVSVWYVFGTVLWTAGVYPLGNVMWRPSTGALEGVLDSIFLWFYGHNLVGLLLTPLSLGAAFYVFPRITKSPLYSHTLGLIAFFSLVAIYTHIGGHHLLQAPIPNWLKTISVVDSIAMVIPVFTALANLWMTARRRAGLLWQDVGGRLVLVGTAAGFIEGDRQYETEAVAPDTIVIHGAEDETVPLANVLKWAEPLELPVTVIPGADHFFHRRLHIIRRIIHDAWRHP